MPRYQDRRTPLTARIKQLLSNPYNVIGSLVLLALTVFNTVRAYMMPITIDESQTYFQHIRFGLGVIAFHFHGQNHTLQSILSFYGTELFGLSFLSLRLGSVFGAVVYTLACIRLSRIHTRGPLLFGLTLLALTINPVVLDFAVVARGYSLALAFFAAALAVCSKELQLVTTASGWKKRLLSSLLISCFCSLSVASNFSFTFANLSLLLVFGLWSSIRLLSEKPSNGPWLRVTLNLFTLAVPGALLFLAVNPAILRMNTASFYFGSATWRDFYAGLIAILFDDPNTTFAFLRVFRLARYILPVLGLFVLLYAALVFLPRFFRARKSSLKLDQQARNWVLIVIIFGLTVASHMVDHLLSGRLLPKDRTGLFLVPLAILIISSSIEGLQLLRPRVRGLLSSDILFQSGRLLLAVLVLAFVVCLRMSWTWVWRFDAGGPEIFSLVSSFSSQRGILHIGVQWPLASAMRFYPKLHGEESSFPDIRELMIEPLSDADRESLFVLYKRDSPYVERENLSIIYEHPISHAVVAVRQ